MNLPGRTLRFRVRAIVAGLCSMAVLALASAAQAGGLEQLNLFMTQSQ